MALEGFEVMCGEPTPFESFCKFVGGAAAVAKVYGAGLTVTWISTGIVEITHSEVQGTYLGLKGMPAVEATTVSGIAGYTVAAGVYNATTRKLRVSVYNASDALADLAALQWCSLTMLFRRENVGAP